MSPVNLFETRAIIRVVGVGGAAYSLDLKGGWTHRHTAGYGWIALAIVIVASLPWSYELIGSPRGRLALLLVDMAAISAGLGFLAYGALRWDEVSCPWRSI